MPATLKPMMAVLGDKPFSSGDYVYEIKFDGIRALTRLSEDGSLSIQSRNGKEMAASYPELADLGEHFLAEELIVDGEIVALDEGGVSRFQLLQGRINLTGDIAIARASKEAPAYYYIFDLLFLDGRDLTGLPLERRRDLLERIFIPGRSIRLSQWIEGEGEAIFRAARENGLEGIMAKRRSSLYRQKRSRDWIKLKAVSQQEFVIGGYTSPRGGRERFGALLVGYYQDGDLVYAGHVGTGFSAATLEEVFSRLEGLKSDTQPFKVEPLPNEPAQWVQPRLVAEIKFGEWTREGILRQPVFLGLRDDKDPGEVVREEPAASTPASAVSEAAAGPFVYPDLPPLVGDRQTVSVGGRRITLTHLDKVFWPEEGYRKYDLINHYHRVAAFILPHLRGRPLTLKRYPDGYGSEPFFQKEAPAETPGWVRTEVLASEGARGKVRYVVCDDMPTLYFLANIACISQNPWLSTLPRLDNPDAVIFDIDPPGPEAFDECIEVALLVRKHLADFGLKGYPKTSGATGIHIYVPVRSEYTFDQTRQFAQVIAWLCREERSDLITLETSTGKRHGKIYLDCLQNVRGKTVASVYSVRAQPGAPVSTPLEWSELESGGLRPSDFNIANIAQRLEQKGDLFQDVLSNRQDLMLALTQGEKFLRAI